MAQVPSAPQSKVQSPASVAVKPVVGVVATPDGDVAVSVTYGIPYGQ